MNIDMLLKWIDETELIKEVAEYLDEFALEEFENACEEGIADNPAIALRQHQARMEEFYRDQGLPTDMAEARASKHVSQLWRKFHELAKAAPASANIEETTP